MEHLIISVLILSNVITLLMLASKCADAIHAQEAAKIERQNITNAASTLDKEWKRFERELAKHRKLNRELASMGGNRITNYLEN